VAAAALGDATPARAVAVPAEAAVAGATVAAAPTVGATDALGAVLPVTATLLGVGNVDWALQALMNAVAAAAPAPSRNCRRDNAIRPRSPLKPFPAIERNPLHS
jgi:hypothetical protein